MACTCCPSLTRFGNEVDAVYPNRDKASDGCCASSSHTSQNPKSDHEPRRSGPARGKAIALDIDEDLTPNGPGPDDLVGLLFHLYGKTAADADSRVRYLIYERRIYYPHAGSRARGSYPYSGANPHDKHLHTSIDEWAWNDPRPWLPDGAPTTPIPPHLEDDLMADPHGTARLLFRVFLGRNPNNQAELDSHAWALASSGLNARCQQLADSAEGKAWEAKQRAA